MSISTLSIRRPVLAIVINLLNILFRFLGFKYLRMREVPSIVPPVVSIRTNYTAFSYTHLDVYKRQVANRRLFHYPDRYRLQHNLRPQFNHPVARYLKEGCGLSLIHI